MSTNAKEIALDKFAQGFNCAESVLMGVAESADLACDCMPRIATGLGAGFGGYGEACGALTGAVMALGLKFGRDRGDDVEAKNMLGAKVRHLMKTFEDKYGSVRCIDLTDCDMKTAEGMERAKELKLHTDFCPKFVAFAAEEAAKLLTSE